MPSCLHLLTNCRNVKRILFSVLISFCFFTITAQVRPIKDKDKEKKKEAVRAERQKNSEVTKNARLKHQQDIQTKKVKHRMNKNLRQTNKYYSKKLHQTFFQRISHWFRKRKIKNKYEHNAAIRVQQKQIEKSNNKY
jgi:hypothetical protein